jgi:hypothetical protein
LIWTDSGLLIYLRAGVRQNNFGGDVAADKFAVVEQGMTDSFGAKKRSFDCPNMEVTANFEPGAASMLHS